MQIIAEVKTQSPFGFKSKKSWDELFEIAERVGHIIAIHTDPRWGGDWPLLEKAVKRTNKPILAKGIHRTDEMIDLAVKCGARYVLVVGRIPETHERQAISMIEPLNLDGLREVPPYLKAVWNIRKLSDGKLKEVQFNEARMAYGGWLCQASNIRTIADVYPQANAVLVGTFLAEFAESLDAKRRIL